MFKYADICFGVGRSAAGHHAIAQRTVRASPMDLVNPDLAKLKASFPYDLWDR